MMIEKYGKQLPGILVLQLASLIVVAFSLWWAVSVFSSLPQTFAVYYDFSGAPNGWVTRSWLSVLQLCSSSLACFCSWPESLFGS